jgi:hypothetical protein
MSAEAELQNHGSRRGRICRRSSREGNGEDDLTELVDHSKLVLVLSSIAPFLVLEQVSNDAWALLTSKGTPRQLHPDRVRQDQFAERVRVEIISGHVVSGSSLKEVYHGTDRRQSRYVGINVRRMLPGGLYGRQVPKRGE